MRRPVTNLAASVRARLLNRARSDGQTFQAVLMRFAIERLLYRLASSPYADQFVLKGAQLFRLWFDTPHRTTKDLDLAGYGVADQEELARIFQEVCTAEVEPDGVVYHMDSVRVEPIRVEQEYHGNRVHLNCRLEQAKLELQIDIGFGDAIVPPAERVEFPALLDFPAPRMRAYPKEATIAEKLHAMVTFGDRNSRTKDFFDLWTLASGCSFQGERLCQAIAATFSRRGTPVPSEAPVALTDAFAVHPDQLVRWRAFLRRLGAPTDAEWAEVLSRAREFLLPPCFAAAAEQPFAMTWEPGGPWRA